MPPVDWNPVWSPDGRFLFFSSDRGGSMNLWRVPIDERTGATLGPPEALSAPTSSAAHDEHVGGRPFGGVHRVGKHPDDSERLVRSGDGLHPRHASDRRRRIAAVQRAVAVA